MACLSPQARTKIYAYTKKRRKMLKSMIQAVKESVPCMDCSCYYPHYVMEFDHVNGDKKFSGMCRGARSITRIEQEMAKCEIVCANCHRVRTASRGGWV